MTRRNDEARERHDEMRDSLFAETRRDPEAMRQFLFAAVAKTKMPSIAIDLLTAVWAHIADVMPDALEEAAGAIDDELAAYAPDIQAMLSGKRRGYDCRSFDTFCGQLADETLADQESSPGPSHPAQPDQFAGVGEVTL